MLCYRGRREELSSYCGRLVKGFPWSMGVRWRRQCTNWCCLTGFQMVLLACFLVIISIYSKVLHTQNSVVQRFLPELGSDQPVQNQEVFLLGCVEIDASSLPVTWFSSDWNSSPVHLFFSGVSELPFPILADSLLPISQIRTQPDISWHEIFRVTFAGLKLRDKYITWWKT